jgi:hypothetical protein
LSGLRPLAEVCQPAFEAIPFPVNEQLLPLTM